MIEQTLALQFYRHMNVLNLIRMYDGGNTRAFCKRVKCPNLGQCLSKLGMKPKRYLSDAVCRHIENVLKLPVFRLDLPIGIELATFNTPQEHRFRIRRENLRDLILVLAAGNVSQFQLDYGLSGLSYYLSGNFQRNIGDNLASRIERTFKMDPGQMDDIDAWKFSFCGDIDLTKATQNAKLLESILEWKYNNLLSVTADCENHVEQLTNGLISDLITKNNEWRKLSVIESEYILETFPQLASNLHLMLHQPEKNEYLLLAVESRISKECQDQASRTSLTNYISKIEEYDGLFPKISVLYLDTMMQLSHSSSFNINRLSSDAMAFLADHKTFTSYLHNSHDVTLLLRAEIKRLFRQLSYLHAIIFRGDAKGGAVGSQIEPFHQLASQVTVNNKAKAVVLPWHGSFRLHPELKASITAAEALVVYPKYNESARQFNYSVAIT
ncbi:hypothetical protein [Vibrio navarrensis]|uniref:hypothetical protein n=1 Tax=Vibrio navarrensis TaxID=29495 RepID=UPI0018DE83BD|nr:hypothetical protein [Vibrio navarrensis]MBH9740001.1 hypothetical protein [Vibrio navarrensis]